MFISVYIRHCTYSHDVITVMHCAGNDPAIVCCAYDLQGYHLQYQEDAKCKSYDDVAFAGKVTGVQMPSRSFIAAGTAVLDTLSRAVLPLHATHESGAFA
jgi:hypothetical protein